MSFLYREKRNGNTYVYQVEAYWDKEKKQSRNKKVLLGKEDENGQIVPTRKKRRLQPQQPVFKTLDTVSVGTSYFLDHVARESGVYDLLEKSFPVQYKDILSCAYYFISERGALYKLSAWNESHQLPTERNLTSQRLSDLLAEITSSQRMDFLSRWADRNRTNDYFALDITSISSYAKSNELVRYGYNRDGEKLPQINMLLVTNSALNVPVFYQTLEGSIKDVKTLKDALAEMSFLGIEKMCLVMDKGFFSAPNVDEMYEESYQFICGVPFTSGIPQYLPQKYASSIETFQNAIVLDHGEVVYGLSEEAQWGANKCWWYAFYNPVRAAHDRQDFISQIDEIKNEYLNAKRKTKKLINKAEKYYTISDDGEVLTPKNDVIQGEMDTSCGWFVALSSERKTPEEVLRIYRGKDPVEKCFDDLKNKLDCNRLRVHTAQRMENRIFIQFIALILEEYIYNKMRKKNLSKEYTLELIMEQVKPMMRIRKKSRNGNTKEEYYKVNSKKLEEVLEAFGLENPS